MIEADKTYTKEEICNELNYKTDKNNEDIKRRLKSCGVEFITDGRGSKMTFQIKKINNPFKLFCILELGVNTQTNFTKLRDFYYYYFNDDEFIRLPDKDKEDRMTFDGKPVSRQTIKRYTDILKHNDLIYFSDENIIYYFALGNTRIKTTQEIYSQAWREYWEIKESCGDSRYAMFNMISKYKGVARKLQVPEVSPIYIEIVEDMMKLIQQSYEREYEETRQTINT